MPSVSSSTTKSESSLYPSQSSTRLAPRLTSRSTSVVWSGDVVHAQHAGTHSQPSNRIGRISHPAALAQPTDNGLESSGYGVGIDDRVRVTLLGQEPLSVCRVVDVEGVPGDHSVEMSLAPIGFGPQDPAETLGLLLA